MQPEDLSKDPIINFYMKTTAENGTILPIYSETSLRLSFKHVLGNYRPFNQAELQLYRKLIAICYSDNYKSINELKEIMTCFNENELNDIFDMYDQLMRVWNRFSKTYLKKFIFQSAVFEMLSEWYRRYQKVFGEASEELLITKANEIQIYLNWTATATKRLFKRYADLFSNKNFVTKDEQKKSVMYTASDLKLNAIFNDIKHKFSTLVTEHLASEDEDESPAPKKIKILKVLDIEVLDTHLLQNASTGQVQKDLQLEVKEEEANDQLTEEFNSDDYTSDFELEEHFDETTYNADADNDENEVMVEIKDTDSEESYNQDEGANTVSDIDEDNEEDNTEQYINSEETEPNKIINYDIAMSHISALQAYAVVNGHFDAIGLLDKVDSSFRKKDKNS